MPTLEILSGSLSGKTFTFSEEAQIGKDESCLVRLNDPGVSRYHAAITKSGGAMQIEDLGSSNGTYVNFKKRTKGSPATLNDRDIIFFGRTVSKFWLEAPQDRPVSVDLLRETVPIKGLQCPKCSQSIEQELSARIQDAERIEVIRRLRLHELGPDQLQQLLNKSR